MTLETQGGRDLKCSRINPGLRGRVLHTCGFSMTYCIHTYAKVFGQAAKYFLKASVLHFDECSTYIRRMSLFLLTLLLYYAFLVTVKIEFPWWAPKPEHRIGEE